MESENRERKRKKHYWLIMERGGVGYIIGNIVTKRELQEYLNGYGDYRELDIDEIFEALLNAKSIRKIFDETIVIHFVIESGEK
jgi:hypothetical protein